MVCAVSATDISVSRGMFCREHGPASEQEGISTDIVDGVGVHLGSQLTLISAISAGQAESSTMLEWYSGLLDVTGTFSLPAKGIPNQIASCTCVHVAFTGYGCKCAAFQLCLQY